MSCGRSACVRLLRLCISCVVFIDLATLQIWKWVEYFVELSVMNEIWSEERLRVEKVVPRKFMSWAAGVCSFSCLSGWHGHLADLQVGESSIRAL